MSDMEETAAPMPEGFGISASSFELAVWKLERAASRGQPLHAPASLARQFLALDRLASTVGDEDLTDALGDQADGRLQLLGKISSRNVGDVAAKLAAVLIASGESEAPHDHLLSRVLARALAELVILGDAPLPDAWAIEAMTAGDLKMRTMSPAEMREAAE